LAAIAEDRNLRLEEIVAKAEAVYLDASALVKSVIVEPPGDHAMRIIYMSGVPLFTSMVGFGEVVSCFGRKDKQLSIGGSWGYLHGVRMLMKDFDIGRIQPVEPPDERRKFLTVAHKLVEKATHLGGGDLWHVMAALELQGEHRETVFLTFDRELLKAAPALGILSVVDGHDIDCEALVQALQAAERWFPA
jgi:predicted nucleic acid-binding protein